MATSINRYSQITPSAYNPMTLQEVMIAPQMMRMRHDQADQALINLQSELAKVDPLDVHLEEANRVRSDINSQVYSQADKLAKEGFNSNILSDIRRTNRNLTDLMSPTGRLGQINNAKKVYQQNFNEYVEDATKNKGWSRERALQNWQVNRQLPYSGFDQSGNIVNIGQYGAPKKIETLEKLKSVKDLLGEQVVKEIGNSGYQLLPQQDGSIVMVDRSGRRIETSNSPNLQNALNLLQQQVNDPEWRNSIQFEGIDPNAVNNEIIYGINSMLKTDVKDNRDTSASLHGYENPNSKEAKAQLDLIENNSIFSPDALATSSYIDNQNTLKSLESKNSTLTPDERGKLNQLKTFQEGVNKTLESNSEYKNINSKVKIEENYIANKIREKFKNEYRVQGSTNPKDKIDPEQMVKRYVNGDYSIANSLPSDVRERSKKYKDLVEQRDEIRNNITKQNSITEYGYQLVPQTAKDETSIKLATETLENALKSSPKSLLNSVNIESVDIDGNSRTKIDLEDKQKIQEVFNNSERGSFKIVSFIPKTSTSKPGYIIEFNTKEGNSANINKWLRNDEGSGDIGDGKPVRIKVSYDQSKGAVLNNANGYIQQYLSDKGQINPQTGRPTGYDLALDMKLNADKSQINNQLAQSGAKWIDNIKPTTDLTKAHPLIVKQLQQELVKNYGLTSDTSDEEVERMIAKFLKEKGNNNVYLE